MLTKQFSYFILSGGVAAGLNWGSRFLFSHLFPFEVAVILAFVVGLCAGFILMRLFVFEGRSAPIVPQAGKYVTVNLFALSQTLLVSSVFARFILPEIGITSNAEAVGHLVGVLVPVVTSYFAHKYHTFR